MRVFQLHLAQCPTRQSIDREINHLVGFCKDSVQKLSIYGSDNQMGKEVFRYFLSQIVERPSFSSLRQIFFYNDIRINLDEANLIISFVQGIMARPSSLKEIHFYRTLMSSEAISYLASVTRHGQSNNNAKLLRLPIIHLRHCRWTAADARAVIPVVATLISHDFSRGVKLQVDQVQVNLQAAKTSVRTCQDLANATNMEIQGLEFLRSSLSTAAVVYLLNLGQQPPSVNSASSTRFLLAEFNECTLFHENERNLLREELVGSFNFFNGEFRFSNMRLTMPTAKVLSPVISLAITTEMLHRVTFHNTNIALDGLPYIFEPIVAHQDMMARKNSLRRDLGMNNSRYTSRLAIVALIDCNFYNEVANLPISCLEWSVHDNALALVTKMNGFSGPIRAEAIASVMTLIAEHPPVTNITHLKICDNEIVPEGMRLIIDRLNRTNLKSLDLSNSQMSNESLISLCTTTLRYNTSLTSLDVSKNGAITVQGVSSILDLLESGNNTTLIDVKCRQDDPTIINRIQYRLYLNRFRTQQLLRCDLPTALYPKVIEKVKDHPSVIFWVVERFIHELFPNKSYTKQKASKRPRRSRSRNAKGK